MKKEAFVISCFLLLLLFHPSAAKAIDNCNIVLQDTLIYDEYEWNSNSGIIPPRFSDDTPNSKDVMLKKLGDSKILKNKLINTTFNVAMVIEKDGRISSFTPSKSAHPLVAKEVINLLKLMPRAKPAVKKGKPVRFRTYYKFAFKNTQS